MGRTLRIDMRPHETVGKTGLKYFYFTDIIFVLALGIIHVNSNTKNTFLSFGMFYLTE